MQIPDRLDRDEEDDHVRNCVEETARVQQAGNIDTMSWYRSIPDSFPWSTFPNLGKKSREVEENQDDDEDAQCPVEDAPTTRHKHPSIDVQDC